MAAADHGLRRHRTPHGTAAEEERLTHRVAQLRGEIQEAALIVRSLAEAATRITDPSRALMLHGPTGEVLDCNELAAELLEVEPGELIGRAFNDGKGELFHPVQPDGRFYHCDRVPLARALRGETVIAAVVGLFRRSGSFSWLSVDAAPMGPGGTVLVSFVEVPSAVIALR